MRPLLAVILLIGFALTPLALAETVVVTESWVKLRGAAELARALEQFEPWLIAGMAGDATRKGRPRIYLPSHDFAQYWRFRSRPEMAGRQVQGHPRVAARRTLAIIEVVRRNWRARSGSAAVSRSSSRLRRRISGSFSSSRFLLRMVWAWR